MLAERHGGRLIREQFEENPFLPRFYEDRERWGFQTQLSFLASRFRQQASILSPELFDTVIFADYAFDKDRIFARVNLTGDEWHLYESLYQVMSKSAATPDLMVYLRTSMDRLKAQIARRGRSYEQSIDLAYLSQLQEAYDGYFLTYDKAPLLIIDTSSIDFVSSNEHFEELSKAIMRRTYSGRHHLRLSIAG